MNRVTCTDIGFSLHDADDVCVGYAEQLEDALSEMKTIYAAEYVRRVRDGEVMARKLRHQKRDRTSEQKTDRRPS